jgi:hypothetical protein
MSFSAPKNSQTLNSRGTERRDRMSDKDRKKNQREAKLRKKQAPGLKRIEEGLYLDFEGYAGQFKPPPILCGYRFGGQGPVKQVVFTEAFKGPAMFGEPDYPVEYCEDRDGFLKKLLFEERTGRKLFVFSPNEGEAIRRILGINIKKGLEDVLGIARGAFPEIKQPRQLIRYCTAAGIPVPSDYGKGKVTAWLNSIKPYSKSRDLWATKAPSEVRENWRLLLRHNRFDVECMYLLMEMIKSG